MDEDLGAELARATRRLVDAEQPILAAHDLSMWEYVVLSQLARAPASTQLALSEAVRYDKTRLIGLLDALQARGLVLRSRDPADRRAHVVTLTEAGQERHAAAQAAIRVMEEQLLTRIGPRVLEHFRATLAMLAHG
jgi:DNA-binding MarR family transcriptional regulator